MDGLLILVYVVIIMLDFEVSKRGDGGRGVCYGNVSMPGVWGLEVWVI